MTVHLVSTKYYCVCKARSPCVQSISCRNSCRSPARDDPSAGGDELSFAPVLFQKMTSIWDLWRSWDLVGLKICRSSVIQSDLHMSSKTRLPFPSLNPVPYLILLKTRLPFPSLNPVPYLILLEQPRKTSIVSAIERVTSLRQGPPLSCRLVSRCGLRCDVLRLATCVTTSFGLRFSIMPGPHGPTLA